MEIKTDKTVKGTRILFDNTAKLKFDIINNFSNILINNNFKIMYLPVVQFQETFAGKVGAENNNMMYNFTEKEADIEPEFLFTDQGNRKLCLAPEYTALIQDLSKSYFKYKKDIKLFYIVECFRGEKPQAGRYRQFTQFGVEIINPSNSENSLNSLIELSENLIKSITNNYNLNRDVTRGLDYYENGKGFEISCNELGGQKQICGGGIYDGGVGFALGIDRIILIK